MDWSNETYVRLYIKDTLTWCRLRWQGQCVMMQLLRKLDRSGTIDGIQDLILDVSIITGMPEDVSKTGIEALMREKVFVHNNDTLIMPNFIEAQEAVKSDRLRQKESRERKRDAIMAKTSHSVTDGHAQSRDVTKQSDPSHDVTLNCALPCVAEHTIAKQKKTPKPPTGADLAFDAFWDAYDHKVGKLNAQRAFKKARKAGLPDSDTLVATIRQQAASKAALKASGVFVPEKQHPSTWLNAGGWTDEIKEIPAEESRPWEKYDKIRD